MIGQVKILSIKNNTYIKFKYNTRLINLDIYYKLFLDSFNFCPKFWKMFQAIFFTPAVGTEFSSSFHIKAFGCKATWYWKIYQFYYLSNTDKVILKSRPWKVLTISSYGLLEKVLYCKVHCQSVAMTTYVSAFIFFPP